MDEAIRSASAAGTKNRVEFYSEFLDVARFPGEEQEQRQRDYFRHKYRERPPDLVFTVSGGALVFLVKHRAEGPADGQCLPPRDDHLREIELECLGEPQRLRRRKRTNRKCYTSLF